MSRNPKSWRTEAGLALARVAAEAGIEGKNPAKTYSRYETGESPCPASVIEVVRKLSRGEVDAESWQEVRLAHLSAHPERRAS